MTEARNMLKRYLDQRDALGEGPIVLERERLAKPTPSVVSEGKGSGASEIPASVGSAVKKQTPGGIVVHPPSTDLFTADELATRNLAEIATIISECERCRLCRSRNNTVPGEGPQDARLVVVGEGPGAREDETGRPFVGRAGELLTDILKAIDLEREAVYICNIVKCRPPSNRTPRQEEIDACVPYLYRQLDIVRPDVILAMGGTAVSTLLERKQSLGSFRGKVHSFRGMPLVATYHPAALLRNPNWKRPTWDDVRIARRILDE